MSALRCVVLVSLLLGTGTVVGVTSVVAGNGGERTGPLSRVASGAYSNSDHPLCGSVPRAARPYPAPIPIVPRHPICNALIR